MKRFGLDAEQTDAILELKIYRLARLEILVIQQELEDKRKRATRRSARCSRTRRAAGSSCANELEEIQKSLRRRKADQRRTRIERRSRGRVLRRRLHRRGRQRRHRVARRLGEAAEGSEGPVDHAPARRRLGAGRARRQHARHRGVLHQLRHRLHLRGSSMSRRPPATASRCRGCSSSRTASASSPPSASIRASPAHIDGEEGRRRAAGARRRGDERRLQPALRSRAVRRASTRAGRRFARVGRRRGGRRRVDRPRRREC